MHVSRNPWWLVLNSLFSFFLPAACRRSRVPQSISTRGKGPGRLCAVNDIQLLFLIFSSGLAEQDARVLPEPVLPRRVRPILRQLVNQCLRFCDAVALRRSEPPQV